MDNLLKNFAAAIEPPKELVAAAKRKTKKIFDLLKKSKRPQIVRCELVGGLAKRTSTRLKADIDAVVYYKDDERRLQRSKVLADIYDLLVKCTKLEIPDFRRTAFLLNFTLEGILVDLVAARDSVVEGEMPALEQMNNDLKEVKKSTNQLEASKDLTLSWQSREWMKWKRPIVVELARLAKFWSQTILFDEVVNGKSYILEVLAVHAFCEEDKSKENGPKNEFFYRCFSRFLRLVKNIETLNVVFCHNNGDWYGCEEIDQMIKKQRPLLLDPVNPYSNLLDINDNVKNKFFKAFSRAATVTLERLKEASEKKRKTIFVLCEVFEPQPSLKIIDYPLTLKKEIAISKRSSNRRILFPKMIQLGLNVSDSDHRRFTQFLQSLQLNVSACIFLRHWRDFERDEEIVDKAVETAARFLGCPVYKTLSGRPDASFQIPVGRKRNAEVAFKLSHDSTKRIKGLW